MVWGRGVWPWGSEPLACRHCFGVLAVVQLVEVCGCPVNAREPEAAHTPLSKLVGLRCLARHAAVVWVQSSNELHLEHLRKFDSQRTGVI